MSVVANKSSGKKAGKSGLGLDNLGDLSSLLNQPAAGESGLPLDLPLDLIDEDPNQPRSADNPGFSKEKLEELAATIGPRGVKSPISVRENPNAADRYLINHGARRFRASKLAGKTTIRAFIDNDYNEADQVIENLQRNDLTAREIADFIGRELAKGRKKIDIASSIGKSPAFVTQHVTLLDLPEPVAEVFNTGRCGDVTVINELVTAHKKHPREVVTFLADETQDCTRGAVKLLREFLDNKDKRQDQSDTDATNSENEERGTSEIHENGVETTVKPSKAVDPNKLRKPVVQVKHAGKVVRLVLDRRPPKNGFAWLRSEEDGKEFKAELSKVKLVAIVEG